MVARGIRAGPLAASSAIIDWGPRLLSPHIWDFLLDVGLSLSLNVRGGESRPLPIWGVPYLCLWGQSLFASCGQQIQELLP